MGSIARYYMIYYYLFLLQAVGSICSLDHKLKRINLLIMPFFLLLLIVFAGFRHEVGFDYLSYQAVYNEVIENQISVEPLFGILIFICDFFAIGYIGMFFLMAFFSVSLKWSFVMRYSMFPVVSFLLYYSRVYLLFDFGQMRQGLALGLILFACPCILHKNFFRFSLVVITAAMFHYSAIIFFIVWFFAQKTIKNQTIFLLLILAVGIAFIDLKPFIIEFIIPYFNNDVAIKLNYYASNEDVLGITFSVVWRICLVVFYLFFVKGQKAETPVANVIFNIYFFGLLFYLFFNSFPQLGGRGSVYFQQFEILLIPILIFSLNKHKLLQFLFIVMILVYSYWGVFGTINSQDDFFPYRSLLF